VKSEGESSIVRISHSAADADEAQEVVKQLVAAIEGSRGSVALGTVIEPPDVPSEATSASPPTSIAFGAGFGLVLGSAFVMLRRAMAGHSAVGQDLS
jgi:uncharacterized protein involved in exopolysaccharide biosynthesis